MAVALMVAEETLKPRELHELSRFHTTCWTADWSRFCWPFWRRQFKHEIAADQLVQMGEQDSDDPSLEHPLSSLDRR